RKPGLFFKSRPRRNGHEHSLHLPRRYVAAEAAEAAAPEATEAATAAPRRIARRRVRYAVDARGPSRRGQRRLFIPHHARPPLYSSNWLRRSSEMPMDARFITSSSVILTGARVIAPGQ